MGPEWPLWRSVLSLQRLKALVGGELLLSACLLRLAYCLLLPFITSFTEAIERKSAAKILMQWNSQSLPQRDQEGNKGDAL